MVPGIDNVRTPPAGQKSDPLGTPWAFIQGTDGAGPFLLMLGAQNLPLWGLSVSTAGRGIICVGLNGAQNTPYISYPELTMPEQPPQAIKATSWAPHELLFWAQMVQGPSF